MLPTLCDPDASFGEAHAAVQALHLELADVTGIVGIEDLATHGEGTRLPGGKAISPAHAAQCLRETTRTVKFLRGIEAALRDLTARVDGPVRVLYAGCGPYGTLLLPLATRWPAERLQVTLLDVHGSRSMPLSRWRGHSAWADRVACSVRADAATYRTEVPFHLAVSETLAQGLRNEPVLAILRNLWPQGAPGAVFLPERVVLSFVLVDMSRQMALMTDCPEPVARDHYPVVLDCGTVVEVSREAAAVWQEEPSWDGTDAAIRCPTLVWPADACPERSAQLIARVHIYGGIVLEHRESSITYPWVPRWGRDAKPGARVAFQVRPRQPARGAGDDLLTGRSRPWSFARRRRGVRTSRYSLVPRSPERERHPDPRARSPRRLDLGEAPIQVCRHPVPVVAVGRSTA